MTLKVFYLTVLCCTLYGFALGKSSNSDESYCYSLSSSDVVKGLWSDKMTYSPLMSELKNAIVSLCTSDDEDISYLTVLSLWSNDRLNGFDPEMPQSYVYAKMINNTVARLDNNYDDEDEGDDSRSSTLKDFRNLCIGATDNSIDIALRVAADCPSNKKKVKYPPMSFSINKKTINKCFESVKNNIPQKLRSIIKKMVESKNADEKVVGLAGIASATDSSIDFFSRVEKSDAFKKMVQLKACNKSLSSQQCKKRQSDLTSLAKKLNNSTKKAINNMLSGY